MLRPSVPGLLSMRLMLLPLDPSVRLAACLAACHLQP